MVRDSSSSDYKETAYLKVNDGTVVDIGYAFAELSGYSKVDFFLKDISEVIEKLLRIKCTVLDLENKKLDVDLFLFSKSYEAIEVIITINHIENTNEKLFIFSERPNSRLDGKLIFVEQLFKDNIMGAAVFSVPDLILLKANQMHLDASDSPFNRKENSIGRPKREYVSGFVGSQAEVVLNTILETQEANNIKELKSEECKRGITYWDVTQTPIFEKGKMKYIFEITTDVTERVLIRERIKELSNQIMEQQKVQLEAKDKMKVTAFGKMEVSKGIKQIHWEGTKSAELFSYMLDNSDKSIHKDELVDALWHDFEYKRASANMQTAMCRVRKSLSELGNEVKIVFSCGYYKMTLNKVYFDKVEFENLTSSFNSINETNVLKAIKIIELYIGDYLEKEGYAWNYKRQNLFRKIYGEILKKTVMFYHENGKLGDAIILLEQVITKNPENYLAKSLLEKVKEKSRKKDTN